MYHEVDYSESTEQRLFRELRELTARRLRAIEHRQWILSEILSERREVCMEALRFAGQRAGSAEVARAA